MATKHVVFKGFWTREPDTTWTHLCGVHDTRAAAMRLAHAVATEYDPALCIPRGRWSVLVRAVAVDAAGRVAEADARPDVERPDDLRLQPRGTPPFEPARDLPTAPFDRRVWAVAHVREAAIVNWGIARLHALSDRPPGEVPLSDDADGVWVRRELCADAHGRVEPTAAGLHQLLDADRVCDGWRRPTFHELL
jgi:hypothetical protein